MYYPKFSVNLYSDWFQFGQNHSIIVAGIIKEKPFEQSFNASKTNKTITAMDIYVIVLQLDKNASAIRKYRM